MNYPDLRGTHLEARELPGEKVEALQTHLRVLSSLEVNITLGAADEVPVYRVPVVIALSQQSETDHLGK